MDEKMVKNIMVKMEEKNTDELLKIYKENNKEEWSNEAFESMRRILAARKAILPEQKQPEQTTEDAKKSFCGNAGLSNLVLTGGISRKALNITAFIGIFIFGWLIAVVFDMLGEGKLGWRYLWPILISFMIARLFAPPIGALALIIYIVAWIHANILLSHYQSLAKERLNEIENRKSAMDVDATIEKGALLGRALRNKQAALDVLRQASGMTGGDPLLLNLAGVIMSDHKQYEEAVAFFDRALQSAKEETMIKNITANRNYVNKKLAKIRAKNK